MIVDVVFKSQMHYTRTRLYYLPGMGSAIELANVVSVNDNFNIVANAADELVEKSLRSKWDVLFDRKRLSTVIEVKFLAEIIDSYKEQVTVIPKPDECLSMLCRMYCFLTGTYTATYTFRAEVYGLVKASIDEIQGFNRV